MSGNRVELGERQLLDRCYQLIADLALRPPLTPDLLCQRLAASRGRAIELVARAIPAGAASGVLVVLPDKDLIIYQAETTPFHQAHIVFHEAVHLVRGHLTGEAPSMCGALIPDGDAAAAGGRHPLYDAWQEWEAETGATILSGWTERAVDPGSAATPDEATRRLESALGGTWQWS